MQPHHRTHDLNSTSPGEPGASRSERADPRRLRDLLDVDVDDMVAEMMGVEGSRRMPVDRHAGRPSQHTRAGGREAFDAAAVSTATAVLAQLQLTMRLAGDEQLVETVADIYERAKELAGLPNGAVGLAATLIDCVRDADHPAVAWKLIEGDMRFGQVELLQALAALLASFTLYIAGVFELQPSEALAEVIDHRHTLGAANHRQFCLAHRAC